MTTTTFTQAMATDLDPGELLRLRTDMVIPRGAVMAILAFLDMHGITNATPAPPPVSVAEWAVNVLAELDPAEVEANVLDAVTPRSGKHAVTRTTIAHCMAAIRDAAVVANGGT